MADFKDVLNYKHWSLNTLRGWGVYTKVMHRGTIYGGGCLWNLTIYQYRSISDKQILFPSQRQTQQLTTPHITPQHSTANLTTQLNSLPVYSESDFVIQAIPSFLAVLCFSLQRQFVIRGNDGIFDQFVDVFSGANVLWLIIWHTFGEFLKKYYKPVWQSCAVMLKVNQSGGPLDNQT